MMRKFGIKFSVHHDEPDTVKRRFIEASSIAEWTRVLEEHYGLDPANPPEQSVTQ